MYRIGAVISCRVSRGDIVGQLFHMSNWAIVSYEQLTNRWQSAVCLGRTGGGGGSFRIRQMSYETFVLLWILDEILHHFETMGNQCIVGIYKGSIIPGFLRWCEMDFVHPQYGPRVFCAEPRPDWFFPVKPFDPKGDGVSFPRWDEPLGGCETEVIRAK